MKIGWVDQIAFWAINRLLSRRRNHRFDVEEFERFLQNWKGKAADEFYGAPEIPHTDSETVRLLSELSHPTCRQLRFPTPAPSKHEQNNSMWMEFHLGHPIDQAPIFLIQHGWRSVSVRGYHHMCRRLNDLGVNAAILHLPYHFSRKPKGSFNGELAISSDIVRSAYALRQAIQEVRWLKGVFKRLGAPAVGLWGTSYGAWISAMAITQDSGFDGALLLEPPVEIERLFWETPLFSSLQRELNRHQIPRERIQELFRLVTPYHHPLQVEPSRVLILGSKHDPIGNPESLQRLQQAWPGTYLEIFPYGHISYRLHTSAVERFLSILAPQLKFKNRSKAPGDRNL